MRYIDLDELMIPDGWLARATAAAGAVAAGDDPDDHRQVWVDLKDALAALFPDKKCWYCESPVDRADNAVDHFRPKGRVRDAAHPHSGYRWLAFDYLNFRYSCTFCNSRRKDVVNDTAGGKADRFPLLDEAHRLYEPGPLGQEAPSLLDPCSWGDWELLGCKQENGSPCAASEEPQKKARVEESIEIYHLDLAATCTRRHRAAVTLLADVNQAKRMYLKAQTQAEMGEEFLVALKRVRKAIQKKAEFSGEMIFLLRGLRSADHPWIQDLLEA